MLKLSAIISSLNFCGTFKNIHPNKFKYTVSKKIFNTFSAMCRNTAQRVILSAFLPITYCWFLLIFTLVQFIFDLQYLF